MLNIATMDRSYTSYMKGWGGKTPHSISGPTTVIQMSEEDLPLIDDRENWSSNANQENWRHHVISRDEYWGREVGSVADLRQLFETGWDKGTQKILDLSLRLRDKIPHPVGNRRKPRWMDQGDDFDKARLYAGQLDTAWRSTPRQRDYAPRVISIDADVGHNAFVKAEDLFWAGACAVALTDALEDAGYRVELFSTSASRFSNGAGLTRMLVKSASQPLNLSLAAAMVALPATFRWYHLNSWLKHPHNIGYGYGQAMAVQPVLEEAVNAGLLDGAEMTISESLSEAAAIKEATEAILRLTGDQDAGEGTMQ